MTEEEYLRDKNPRTLQETIDYLRLRRMADGTEADARLMIVYEEAGAFRRVFARGLRGRDIEAICDALDGAPADRVACGGEPRITDQAGEKR